MAAVFDINIEFNNTHMLKVLSSSILSFSILATTCLPVLAQETNTTKIPSKLSQENRSQITLVEVITVKFPNDIEFDPGSQKRQPVVLSVAQPVYNSEGKVVIPAESRVDAALVSAGEGKDKGTMIVAKSLIINGKPYPLNATLSTKIPARKITKKSRIEQLQVYASSVNNILPGSINTTDDIGNAEIDKSSLIIKGAAGLIGYLSPHSKLTSSISKGGEYILYLQQPLSLDIVQDIPVIAENPSSNEAESQVDKEFTINNQEEYNQVVEQVIVDYQEEKISQSAARNIVESANQYVRNDVNPILYPDESLRKQVSDLIGFDYAIDRQ